MPMKEYSAFPKAPVLLEPCHQSVIFKTLVGGGVLSPLQKCSQCILQPQLVGLSITKIFMFYTIFNLKNIVCVYYTHRKILKNIVCVYYTHRKSSVCVYYTHWKILCVYITHIERYWKILCVYIKNIEKYCVCVYITHSEKYCVCILHTLKKYYVCILHT